MRDPGHAPIQAGARRRWIRTVRAYLREPAVLTIIAVAFFISAAGQRFGSTETTVVVFEPRPGPD